MLQQAQSRHLDQHVIELFQNQLPQWLAGRLLQLIVAKHIPLLLHLAL